MNKYVPYYIDGFVDKEFNPTDNFCCVIAYEIGSANATINRRFKKHDMPVITDSAVTLLIEWIDILCTVGVELGLTDTIKQQDIFSPSIFLDTVLNARLAKPGINMEISLEHLKHIKVFSDYINSL